MKSTAIIEQGIHSDVIFSALATNTRIAYEKGWSRFIEFCDEIENIEPLSASPDAVARFLIHLATKPSTRSGTILSMGTVTLLQERH